MKPRPSREFSFRWLLALVCFAILIFFFSPSWGAFLAWARVPELWGMLEVRRGVSVLLQVENPGMAIPDALHGAIQWRLLFPVIGHVLHLPSPVFFALAHVGCVAALGFVIAVLRRLGAGFLEAGLATVMFGAGAWFFASAGWLGYFDSWVVLGLLLVGFARTRWTAWAACIWAPWVDERFVIAVPLALLCRWLLRVRGSATDRSNRDWVRELAIPAILIAVFLIVRLGLLAGRSVDNATITGYLGQLNVFDVPWSRVLLGVWEGLRVGWFFVGVAIVAFWHKRVPALVLAAAVIFIVLVGLRTAQDFGRSMMFVAPAVLLGLMKAFETRPRWLPWALRGGALATLLLPAHHVMSDRVNPIYYLYHELAALRSPPPAIMPELIELRAIRAMQQGDLAQAEADLTLAIKLAANPAGPSKQRGVLFATQQRWEEARRDFSAMVEHDPLNPDGWFLRAQAAMALGDGNSASDDVRRALELGSDEWAARPDVARFIERWKQTAAGR